MNSPARYDVRHCFYDFCKQTILHGWHYLAEGSPGEGGGSTTNADNTYKNTASTNGDVTPPPSPTRSGGGNQYHLQNNHLHYRNHSSSSTSGAGRKKRKHCCCCCPSQGHAHQPQDHPQWPQHQQQQQQQLLHHHQHQQYNNFHNNYQLQQPHHHQPQLEFQGVVNATSPRFGCGVVGGVASGTRATVSSFSTPTSPITATTIVTTANLDQHQR